MSIANQIQRIKTNITNAYNEIEKFNVNISEYNNKSDKLAEAISNITVGETINNQNKIITENGTYTYDEGYTGLGEVVVDVDCGSNAEIPAGYTELVYLSKTSGSGYIDLYYKANQNTKIELDFKIIGYSGTNANGFFGYYSSGSDGFYVSVASASSENSRSWACKINGASIQYINPVVDKRYKMTMAKDGLFVDDELIGIYDSISDFSTGGNCYLFRINGYDRDMYTQVYGLKVFESDELIHHYVPVQRKDSFNVGMFDLITGVFYEPNTQAGFRGVKLVKLTINPTPLDATVMLSADGYAQEDSGNCIYVTEGTEVTYSVSADGYITKTGNITVNSNQTIDISLTVNDSYGGNGDW